jgi:hypothetical protein
MKSPIFPIVCAAGFAVLALTAGCESTPVRHPRTTQTVILSADKPAPDVEIEVVTAIRVLLPGRSPDRTISGRSWATTAASLTRRAS